MRLSKNRFAGFYSPQNEFCGGPILFDRLWSPELRASAPYAALAARPRRAVAPACGPVSPNFCENLAGYGVFSRHMSVKKHSIGKSLQFCSLFRQAERDAKGVSFSFAFCSGPISRVLWSAAIYLGRTLLSVSLPPVWRLAEQAVAPKSVLLRIEFTGCPGHPGHRWALTPPFHLFPAGGAG